MYGPRIPRKAGWDVVEGEWPPSDEFARATGRTLPETAAEDSSHTRQTTRSRPGTSPTTRNTPAKRPGCAPNSCNGWRARETKASKRRWRHWNTWSNTRQKRALNPTKRKNDKTESDENQNYLYDTAYRPVIHEHSSRPTDAICSQPRSPGRKTLSGTATGKYQAGRLATRDASPAARRHDRPNGQTLPAGNGRPQRLAGRRRRPCGNAVHTGSTDCCH